MILIFKKLLKNYILNVLVIIIYIFFISSYRCRHAVFSKYFGDSPPLCRNKCDICKNKDEVRARIAQFEMYQSTAKKFRSNVGSATQINYGDHEMYVKN